MDHARETVSIDSLAFNIGWDAGVYGMEFWEDWPIDLRQGWAEARKKYPKPSISDRFVRKWIQLRVGAFRRGKVFSESVTPGYLKAIDNSLCPISSILLTHGDGAETDWSIDRIDNERGYERQNLMVVSTRVNKAKADLSFTDVERIASRRVRNEQLTSSEWTMLYYVLSMFVKSSETDVADLSNYYKGQPVVPDIPLNWIMCLQVLIAHSLLSNPPTGLKLLHIYAIQSANEDIFKKFAKRCLKIRRAKGKHAVYYIWTLPTMQKQFCSVLGSMKPRVRSKLQTSCEKISEDIHSFLIKKNVEQWAQKEDEY